MPAWVTDSTSIRDPSLPSFIAADVPVVSPFAMSTTRPTHTATCSYRDCDANRDPANSVEGSYCSQPCYYRAQGTRLLTHIRDRRHEICGTCFRLTKDIDRPPEEYLRRHFQISGVGWSREGKNAPWTIERYGQEVSRDSVIGFADITEHAAPGPWGLECRCGAVDHDIDDQAVRDTQAWEWWLQVATEYLREIGARDDIVRAPTVAHAYWRTDDLRYAVGLALEASET